MKGLQGKSVISLDCFGTLIDWESGVVGALEPILASHGRSPGREAVLSAYLAAERCAKRATFLPYHDLLATNLEILGEMWGFVPTRAQKDAFVNSAQFWPLFEGEAAALRALGDRFTLALVADCNHATVQRLVVSCKAHFSHILISEQLRSYKPSLHNFRRAIEEYDALPAKILHVAQSVANDLVPAKKIGLTTVCLNRATSMTGATSAAYADFECESMRSLASRLLTPGVS